MTAPTFDLEHHGDVTVFRMQRPPANALDLEYALQLDAALMGLFTAGDTGAVVLTGAGSCFSAGLDLKTVPHYDRDQQRAMVGALNSLFARVYTADVPVVGAVNGHAIAGGLVLALACDYRVGPSAPCQLGLTEARVGVPFPVAAMAVVRAELAPPVARILTLQARNVGPEQALAWQVLDELEPPERVVARAVAVAQDMASLPRDSYPRIKRQLRADAIAPMEAALVEGKEPLLDAWLSNQAAAASAAVLRGG